jgi:antitoxin component YwqK of YwqJK toxin-antitoxin module
MDQERYLSLAETCQMNGFLMQDILDKHAAYNEKMTKEAHEKDSDAKKLRQEYVVPEVSQEDVYIFDESKYHIKDAELEIDYTEDFSNGTSCKKETMSYPSGKIKWEKYYKNEALHGPSSFFGEDGTLLGRIWYIDGKQTGKVWTYHVDGSLHSLQRFDQGLPVGIHQYFFSNGLPKSILPYKGGVLDGEIHLFNPHGMIFRRLSFVNGKRTGQEQIWDKNGQLIVECQYEADRPVGLTRMWHPNGILAKEFLYDKDSRRIEAKEWDSNGEIIVQDESKNDDYFDLVNKETEKLTQSLSDMVKKMTTITPLISDKFHFDAKAPFSAEEAAKQSLQYDLANEMENLQKELAKLQSLDAMIKVQLEQGDETKEALWKTPSSRREMEKQFEGMREKINGGLSEIKKGIKTVVKSLVDEAPKKD